MHILLYQPNHAPKLISAGEFYLPDKETGFSDMIAKAAPLLQCLPSLVDVLACGPDYIAFSIFDYEGESNLEAVPLLSTLTGAPFDFTNEDEVLRGPILIVHR